MVSGLAAAASAKPFTGIGIGVGRFGNYGGSGNSRRSRI